MLRYRLKSLDELDTTEAAERIIIEDPPPKAAPVFSPLEPGSFGLVD